MPSNVRPRSWAWPLFWALLFSFSLALAARAAAEEPESGETAAENQAAATAPVHPSVEQLTRQVEAITRELERLRLGGDVVAEADSGVLGFGPAASKIYKVDEGVSVGGYGEVLYRMTADELEDGTESPADDVFDALRAIIYLGYKFNDKLLVNTEIEIEHANEAFLEFGYLEYRINENLGVRGGLLLSPMGLVNELHEPPVFLGTTRSMVESQLIPSTWRENGIGVFGDTGRISYRAYVLNGLEGTNFSAGGLRGGRQKGSKALANDLATVLRVDYTGTPGLLFGGSIYTGGSGQNAAPDTLDGREIQAKTTIWEAHVSYQSQGVDAQALIAGAKVEEADLLNTAYDQDVAERLEGGYAQVGYDVLRFSDTRHQLFPYLRYEWLNTQAEVPEGVTANPANDRTAILVGASWKPDSQVAVKADYQIHSNEADTGRNQFALVLSYLF